MDPLPPRFSMRPLRRSDIAGLLEFSHSHTGETVFQRYHYWMPPMSPARALMLLSVDQHRDVALAIFEGNSGEERIHAVGRYYTERSGKRAEVAFVVRESMRRLGLATHLLMALGEIARAHGLGDLRAQTLTSNTPMRQMLARLSPQTNILPDDDVVECIIPSGNITARHFDATSHHSACR